jgi:hypothetical protein
VQTSVTGKAVLTRLDVVPNWQKTTIARWAVKALAVGTHVVSDGLATFAAVKDVGFTHEPIVVGSTGKAAGQHPRFWALNTMLGNLKTWMADSPASAYRYGNNFSVLEHPGRSGTTGPPTQARF